MDLSFVLLINIYVTEMQILLCILTALVHLLARCVLSVMRAAGGRRGNSAFAQVLESDTYI